MRAFDFLLRFAGKIPWRGRVSNPFDPYDEASFRKGDQVLLPSGRNAEVVRTEDSGDTVYVRTPSEPLLRYAAYELRKPSPLGSIPPPPLGKLRRPAAEVETEPPRRRRWLLGVLIMLVLLGAGAVAAIFAAPHIRDAVELRRFMVAFKPVSESMMRVNGEFLSACAALKNKDLNPNRICEEYAALITTRIDGLTKCIAEAEAIQTSGKGAIVKDAFVKMATSSRDINYPLREAALKKDVVELARVEQRSEYRLQPMVEEYTQILRNAGIQLEENIVSNTMDEMEAFVNKHDPGRTLPR